MARDSWPSASPTRSSRRQREDLRSAADDRVCRTTRSCSSRRSGWRRRRRVSTATVASSAPRSAAATCASRPRATKISGGPVYGNAVLAPLGTRPAFTGTAPPIESDRAVRQAGAGRAELRDDGGGAVKRAILTHRRDFIAIAVLIVGAVIVTGYILQHQPSFTFGQSYYTIDAEFSEASAVTSGQGQPVTIAGVQVGRVGSISLARRQGGRADEHRQAVRPPRLSKRKRAVAAAHAAEGHVPVAGSGNGERGTAAGGVDAWDGADQPRRRRVRDPLLARRRYPQLPAAAAVGRRPDLP